MRRRTVVSILAGLFTGLVGPPAFSVNATQIWLSATEPTWRAIRHLPPNDYMDLFRSGSPWKEAAARVSVFELSKRAVLETDDRELVAVLTSLRQHGIRLSVQATPLFASRACGLGVEGHGPPDDMLEVASRLKRLGADLAYLRMDEPLWFGHRFNSQKGVQACHHSIAQIAQETATKVRAVRQIYPGVLVGDIEPAGVPPSQAEGWGNDVREWLAAYRQAVGELLGFFHIDVVWQRPTWRPLLLQMVAAVREHNIPLGIIYNGTPQDQTDKAWVSDAATHFRTIEGEMNIHPDHAVIQSWMDYPRAMLPETDPGALTNLVLQYSKWLSRSR